MRDQHSSTTGDRDIARALRAAGRRPEIPPAMKADWEARFREQLQPVLRARRARRFRALAGACATLAALALGLGLYLRQPAPEQRVIRVVSATDTVLEQADGTRLPLRAGHYLVAGSTLESAAGGHAAVDYAGYDLRLNGATRVAFTDRGIGLPAGELYASSEAGSVRDGLAIRTPQGTLRDIGTQFTVAVDGGRTVATVRAGAVAFDTGGARHVATAGAGSATRLTVGGGRDFREESVPLSGEDWRWIYRDSPSFDLDGSSPWEFLQWSVRESGLELVFASPAAEIYARTEILHGTLPPRDPEQAVAIVLAATDLTAERRGGTLTVRLGNRLE